VQWAPSHGIERSNREIAVRLRSVHPIHRQGEVHRRDVGKLRRQPVPAVFGVDGGVHLLDEVGKAPAFALRATHLRASR
jgi:hypothetical protein